MSLEHSPSKRAERPIYSVSGWLDEVPIGRTKFYSEVADGRIKIRKCGSRSLVETSPREYLESLPKLETEAA